MLTHDNSAHPNAEARSGLPRPAVFAATLYQYWAHLPSAGRTPTSTNEPASRYGHALATLLASVGANWTDADRHTFIEAQLNVFQHIHEDATVLKELERRSLPETEQVAIMDRLSDLSHRFDEAGDDVAVRAVIAGLIGRYYSPQERADYILDYVVDDTEFDDTEFDESDEPIDVEEVHTTSAKGDRVDAARLPIVRGLGQMLGTLAVIFIPGLIAARFTPVVGSTYQGVVFVPTYAVVWLLLGLIYQSARGNLVNAWRCAFLAGAIICGAITYFQLGWHWVAAKATSPETMAYQQERLHHIEETSRFQTNTQYIVTRAQAERDLLIAQAKEHYDAVVHAVKPNDQLTPFPSQATPLFVTLTIVCVLAALASRRRIEMLLAWLNPGHQHS